MASSPESSSRRRLLLGVTLALPWILLALVEVGLRLGGCGSAYPLFVPYAAEPGFLFLNEQVGRRWFRGPFVPSTRLDFFHAAKAPNGIRVVFQGESSAAGFPYGHGGAPSAMLEQRLQATFPDRQIEVVNTAMTAVSSYVLLDQADEIIALHPDAVLIYTGHNEYYGVFGAASANGVRGSRGVVRAYLALRRLRLVQLVENLISRERAPAKADAADAPRTVMELMAGHQLVPAGSARFGAGVAQFRANLDALLAKYEAAHVPVLVGTLVSNERDQPPFVNGPAPRGGSDTLDANAAYALARAREAAGDTAAARALYRAAKERDALRFRAPEALNDVIREVAARHGATVVETQRAVERASPGGIPGRSLILEHVHPNVDGYFTLADAFYEALRAKGMFGAWPSSIAAADARRTVAVTEVDSIAAALRTDRLTSGWPFRPRGVTAVAIVDTLHPRTPAESLAQRLVQGSMSWAEATDRLRAEDEKAGDADGSIRAAEALAREYRYSPQPYLDAARVALASGRTDDALRYARQAQARRETPQGAELLGALVAARLLPRLEAQRAQAPRDTVVLLRLAQAYALTQRFDSARAALRSLLVVSPANAAARDLLQRLPQ
jgi:lysophospholipase L1-like esterase